MPDTVDNFSTEDWETVLLGLRMLVHRQEENARRARTDESEARRAGNDTEAKRHDFMAEFAEVSGHDYSHVMAKVEAHLRLVSQPGTE